MHNNLEEEISTVYRSLLGMISIICMLFWWVPLLFGIGNIFVGEFVQAAISLFITTTMLIFWKGGEDIAGKDKK